MKFHCLFLIVGLIQWTSATPVTEVPNFTKLSRDEIRHLQNKGFGPTVPSPYASTYEEHSDTYTAASQQRPVTAAYTAEDQYLYQNAIPIRQKVHSVQYREPQQVARPKNIPQQFRPGAAEHPREHLRGEKELNNKQLEEELEIEEPDRLSILLPQSKFACNGKNTGYYADEELGCEVFHYCQDNARHSWICPEGFTFHQVHLICMPPGGDNICEKSSQFHFVNEYLYKPVNLEEYQQKPNVSLKYSDRYYPDSYYAAENYDEEERPIQQHRNSIRVTQQPIAVPKSLLVDQVTRTTFRPETTLAQEFRSPNEVNIPLQNRRPQYLAPRYLHQRK